MKKYRVDKTYLPAGLPVGGWRSIETQIVEAESDEEAIKKAKERTDGYGDFTIREIIE